MTTPICDFVRRYASSGAARLHMPGHKGAPLLGCEGLDITEISGADSLYDPQGIIRESEENARGLFGAGATLYSTEGSSQCIRAMLFLAMAAFLEKRPGARPAVIAGRNVHKAFLTACALLDLDIAWLYPENQAYSLCRCHITPGQLEGALHSTKNAIGVYLTSPDYLGHMADIPALAEAAHRYGAPLLVDNAHGAYLRFCAPSRHPMDLGADMCCDSAHKTLPVLTGGAYLHIHQKAPALFTARAREAMALFGSTSPSYLLLQSLDMANRVLAGDYSEKLAGTLQALGAWKARLAQQGWCFAGDEPMKITLDTRPYGYTGTAVGGYLESRGFAYEYADPDYLVLMPTPDTPADTLARLEEALPALQQRPPLPRALPPFQRPETVLPLRQALFLPHEEIPARQAAGRVAASLAAACPPAISPAVPGERISPATVAAYQYYGIETVSVLPAL